VSDVLNDDDHETQDEYEDRKEQHDLDTMTADFRTALTASHDAKRRAEESEIRALADLDDLRARLVERDRAIEIITVEWDSMRARLAAVEADAAELQVSLDVQCDARAADLARLATVEAERDRYQQEIDRYQQERDEAREQRDEARRAACHDCERRFEYGWALHDIAKEKWGQAEADRLFPEVKP
jgi:chromosome segregation ATPase